jgi:DnaJ-class molecular chaperone
VFKIAARQPEPSGFQRIGHSNDLVFTQEITLADALWDCRFALTHLDGQQVLVNVPKTGQSLFSLGQMVMVKGQGMPIYSAKAPRYSSLRDQADKPQRGDLYVKFNVAFPSRDEILSDPEKRKVPSCFVS